MYSRSARPQCPSARTCSAQPIGWGDTVWMENPRAKPRAGVGLVEVLGGHLGWRGFVHAQLGREPPGALGGALDHDVAADLVLVVAEPVREAGARWS